MTLCTNPNVFRDGVPACSSRFISNHHCLLLQRRAIFLSSIFFFSSACKPSGPFRQSGFRMTVFGKFDNFLTKCTLDRFGGQIFWPTVHTEGPGHFPRHLGHQVFDNGPKASTSTGQFQKKRGQKGPTNSSPSEWAPHTWRDTRMEANNICIDGCKRRF